MIPPGRWSEADALIDDLLALPPEARRQALDARTDLDPELRRMVAAVLAEADAGDPFLDPAAVPRRPVIDDLVERFAGDRGDALRPGGRFGSYDVVALVGRGGMGEVYRARDSRLGRDVALKTMPLDFEDDPERAARLDREARVLASLNHPNIAAIYGIAEEGGRCALVLEFVEGETLASVISRGPVPLSDTLSWLRGLALALHAAHRRGVVHRDLKPSNIAITADRQVKVLDFGLAKALGDGIADPDDEGLTAAWKPDGAVLGTPAYMAPEQALGEPAGERADAWALGCVLYEMLTGARPFTGDTGAEVLTRVLTREPDLARLPAGTPAWLRDLLTRLLLKDPGRRLGAADVVAELDHHQGSGAASTAASGFRHRAAVLLLASGAVAVAGFIAVMQWWPRGAPAAPVQLAVPVPASDALLLSAQQVAAISPDGRTVVYRAIRDGRVYLFARPLDALESRPIAGTENAAAPFFSPDGAWVGFDGDGAVQTVPLEGGTPSTICAAPGGANATWAGDTIVFATATGRVLQKVAAAGGAPDALTVLDRERGDLSHGFPHLLPRADAVLFTITTPDRRHVAVVDVASRDVRLLVEGSQPRYLDGRLLFIRNDSLWTAPFDERTRQLTGEPHAVLDRLDTAGGSAAHYAVSGNGTLVYVPRREEVRDRRLVWVDRHGKELPLPLEPKRYQRATLSPDGRRVAVALTEGDNTDIWIGDVARGTLTRLTKDATTETAPLWSPDGRAIVFRSDRDGGGLYVVAVDRPGDTRRVTSSGETMHTPHSWTPDGRTLLYTEFRSYTDQVFAAVGLDGAGGRVLVGGSSARLRPHVSPDGRWIAYQSDESGQPEIYLKPYPSLEGEPVLVSIGGGTSPRWARGGRELLYYDGRGVLSAPIDQHASYPADGKPTRLFDYSPYGGRLGPDFDVTPDGERFLMIRPSEDTPASRAQLVIVQNWSAGLRAPATR